MVITCTHAGQKQLVALARGLLKLRTSSILILDESTASLGTSCHPHFATSFSPTCLNVPRKTDHATDESIQQTIREEMQDATILCIARTSFPNPFVRNLEMC